MSSSADLLHRSSKMKPLSELMSRPTQGAPPPDGYPQIASSPGESYSMSSPGSSQDRVPSPPNLGDDFSSDNHPLPTSPSNPGPSTELNPLPSAKRPRPEELETSRSSLYKKIKAELKHHVPSPPTLGAALLSDTHPLPR